MACLRGALMLLSVAALVTPTEVASEYPRSQQRQQRIERQRRVVTAAAAATAPPPPPPPPRPAGCSGLVTSSGALAPGSIVMIGATARGPGGRGDEEEEKEEEEEGPAGPQWGVVRGFDDTQGRYVVDVGGRGQELVHLEPENVYIEDVVAGEASASMPGRDTSHNISLFLGGGHSSEQRLTDPESLLVRKRLLGRWDAAFRQFGFASIVGHSVDPLTIRGLRSAARRFFSQPESEKTAYHRPARVGQVGAVLSALIALATTPTSGCGHMYVACSAWHRRRALT
jgi:hypothetical protein